MTLSQRLIRAGLTFIILGTAAALLPQQNEAAQATSNCNDCTKVTINYRLSPASCGGSTFFSFVKSGTPVKLYASTSQGNGPYSLTSAAYSYTGSTSPGKAFTSPGTSTTGSPTSSGSVKANFTVSGHPTYTIQYPIYVY